MYLKTILTLLVFLSIPSYATEITKKQWGDAMESGLPVAFCNSKMYFRQCFAVTPKECEDVSMSATRVCLKKSKKEMPDVLIQPKDGTHWGRIIGSCAGEAYEAALNDKKISNSQCDDANNWK